MRRTLEMTKVVIKWWMKLAEGLNPDTRHDAKLKHVL
jgi:hypothetical protein